MLVCEAINREKRLLPLLLRYRDCLPLTGLEPFPAFIKGSRILGDETIKGITKGESVKIMIDSKI